ncbi:GlxA family transcriptional regulator [Pelagibacterium halotolerans]|uniref:GlxA family transcriptional regulator n=1 Tax=Pelagibacterium halotolerans TaxID=531813 RepID=UPI00384C74EC
MDSVASKKQLFVFYLLPEFTLLAFSSAIEALRLANMVLGFEAYRWRLASHDGGEVCASSGVPIRTESSVAAERQAASRQGRPSMVVVCGGLNIQNHSSKTLESWLRECRQNKIAIAGLCTGAHVLAQARLLNDKKCVIHWENVPSFVERFGSTSVRTGLFAIDGNIHTCAGGAAAFDMMLHIIRRDFGEDVVTGVCERAIVDRMRNSDDRQRLPFSPRVEEHHPALTKLIERMQETLAEPVSVDELMADLGLTRRQVERLFRNALRNSPARYYMKLRLERARLLLQQTSTPIVEVAFASGFSSASHFSKAYRDAYGCSPHEVRKVNRTLFPNAEIALGSDLYRLSETAVAYQS